MSPERSVKDLFGLYTHYFGGAEGIRTLDLLDAIEARSQLRHGPTERYQFNIFATGQVCAEMSEGSCNPISALQVQLNAEQ